MLMAIAGAIGLIWKMKLAHVIAQSCAAFGASIAVHKIPCQNLILSVRIENLI
jgi:hypothetical protein